MTIRVLRLIARMNVGGPALQVVALTRGLRPPLFETRLLIGHVGEGEADYLTLRAPDVEARHIRGLGRSPNPAQDAAALARIITEIRAFRPHIVHTHTAKAGVLGRAAALACRVPATVHTFHGHLLSGYFAAPARRAIIRTEATLARRTTRLVAVGALVRDQLLSAGIGNAGQFVPPGVDLPPGPGRSEARLMLGLPPLGPVVTFVARLTQVKRPDRFASVALELSRRLPDASFAIAGEGALLDDLRRRMAPLAHRAHFLGWRADVETVYDASDVVVLTSDNEGMPVSLIEAAACGVPAVTTDVGSAREVVVDSETGYVTSTGVDDIADAVERILRSADPMAMGRAAKRRAAERFSAARLVSDTSRIYEELAKDLDFSPRA
jgi:glycosyltransferase involved in cell wall biosynthesis